MTRYDRRSRALAVCLSALAGFVDSLGFIALGGFFVSFMSGNSTRLSVGLVSGLPNAAVAAGLIGAFVLGVMLGSLVGHVSKDRRPVAVLALVAAMLALGAGLAAWNQKAVALGVVAAAMGAENAIFERDGEVSIALTYMTGTLVKFGQRLTAALLGGDRFAWAPYLMLWAGLVAGAMSGTATYPHLGLQALWIAAGAAAVLCLACQFGLGAGDRPSADKNASESPTR
jgi:uncharacterized membrane protein YoaK (UPF0700 family)